jgi:DNA-binding response OmpR family regulator
LEQDEMDVDCAYDGQEAYDLAMQNKYDMILLDVMLPKMDGFEVLQKIRETSKVPVIMLTAKAEDMDKILGLEYGADDYITKPFNILEVKARIKAIMRRMAPEKSEVNSDSVINSGDFVLNLENRRCSIKNREINLTSKEFDMVYIFLKNPGKVFSRDELLQTVWGNDYPGDARTVDVHIRRLREKIETNPGEPRYIHTKWGMGYFYKV